MAVVLAGGFFSWQKFGAQEETPINNISIIYTSENYAWGEQIKRIELSEDGKISYYSKIKDKKEESSQLLTEVELKELSDFIISQKFFDLPGDLTNPSCADAPTEYLEITINSKTHRTGGSCVENEIFRIIVEKLEGFVNFQIENFKRGSPSVVKPELIQTDYLEQALFEMTLEEKIGQMFMLGIFTDDLELWKKEFLQKRNIGGIILHPYNVKNEKQLRDFIASLQGGVPQKDWPLFIAVNQEGGDEEILGGEIATIKFAKEKRGGRVIKGEDVAFEVGLKRAQELKELGVNVNFAPVVDVVQEENSFLYSRSFSGDPEKVASLARSYIKGQREGGIISTAKHFPGHGVSIGDSHVNIPISPASREDLQAHLLPFREAIEEGVEMIMATHMFFPNIDKENPVPFSSFFINDILRSELGFEGIVVTDDIEMKAVRPFYSVPEAALAAVKAGVDIIVISGIEQDQKKSYEALLNAVKSGEITEERINESLRRILKIKTAY